MDIKDSKILVIGGAGFIGSFVVAELLKEDVAEVVIYDNFTRGKREYLTEQLKDPRCSIYPIGGDVRDLDILDAAVNGKDYVISLTAMWLLHCKDYPRTAFEVNIAGTFNVLEACVKHKIKKLVWSSSASVYGDAVQLPMTESHPFNNKNFYGATKIAGEAMATAYNDRYGLPVIGLRYMNVYGPHQDQTAAYTGVVPIMLNKIEANEAPIINGDGSQAYDFIYVEDVARCNVDALKSDVNFGMYNVGTEVQTSIKELCELILSLKQSNLKVVYNPYSADDARSMVQNRIGSRKKAEEEIGFKYKYTLEEGLLKLIDWRIETGTDSKKIMTKRIAVVGGGIVGLATAYKLQKKLPGAKVTLFEKEKELGQHQSGRNSGVLHCGLYYQPGSLKAKLAVSGIQQMTNFCEVNQIPHDLCGKIVVASNDREIKFLEDLADRGTKNGLADLRYLNKEELHAREPFVSAKKALLVPQEGIVDYKAVMQKLASLIKENNGEIILGAPIQSIKNIGETVVASDGKSEWEFDLVFNCAGLHSDRNYQKFTGNKRPLRIVPFRGEYLMLKQEYNHLVNHLIYPVPDPEYPFLGVHFTRLINGAREVGPNAVFALKREGYTNTDISIADLLDAVTYKGFINFLVKNFTFSMNEFGSSLFTALFLKKAKKLIPDINATMFVKGTAGVRAQAMDASGKLLMDFNIIREKNQVHVLNAPSPGATASLAIADHILNEYL